MALTKTVKSDHALSEKVEQMGILIEEMGYAPIPGRILSYLLISEPPYRDFYEIQNFLKASKSSVSTTLNQLMQKGVINYITFSGDRKRYFQINSKGLQTSLKQQYKQGQLVTDMVRETLQQRKNSGFQRFNRELKELIDFNSYILTGIDKLIIHWEKTHP